MLTDEQVATIVMCEDRVLYYNYCDKVLDANRGKYAPMMFLEWCRKNARPTYYNQLKGYLPNSMFSGNKVVTL